MHVDDQRLMDKKKYLSVSLNTEMLSFHLIIHHVNRTNLIQATHPFELQLV